MLWHLHCSLPKGLYSWDCFIGKTCTQSLHETHKLSQVYFIVQLFNALLIEIGHAKETSYPLHIFHGSQKNYDADTCLGCWCSTSHLNENVLLLCIVESKLKDLCNLNTFHNAIILSLTSAMQGLKNLVLCLRVAGFISRQRVILGTFSVNVQRHFKCSTSAQDWGIQQRDGGNFCQ